MHKAHARRQKKRNEEFKSSNMKMFYRFGNWSCCSSQSKDKTWQRIYVLVYILSNSTRGPLRRLQRTFTALLPPHPVTDPWILHGVPERTAPCGSRVCEFLCRSVCHTVSALYLLHTVSVCLCVCGQSYVCVCARFDTSELLFQSGTCLFFI